ncbi:MAG: hypothetical protein JNK77_03725 [Saprospiraceae bacterium]|nr:hypothetical protein [Saprospiraceae bacterium]
MKTLLLTLFAFFLTVGTSMYAMSNDPAQPKVGDIKITLYGSGGIVSSGDTQKVCPQTSTAVCANVVVQATVAPGGGGDLELDGLEGVLDLRGSLSRIRFVSGTATKNDLRDGFEANGKNVSFVFLQ